MCWLRVLIIFVAICYNNSYIMTCNSMFELCFVCCAIGYKWMISFCGANMFDRLLRKSPNTSTLTILFGVGTLPPLKIDPVRAVGKRGGDQV